MPRLPKPDPWDAVTPAAVRAWAGERAAERGRAYQREGYVHRLAVDASGQLLATVEGTERYATAVAPRPLASRCSCPVGVACKHAVAVIAEYQHAVGAGRPVPDADPDDPRWDRLEADESDDWDDEEDDEPPPRRTGPARPAAADAEIERHVRGCSQGELADLLLALTKRLPDVRRALRDRVALRQGDAAKLLAETRRAIHNATEFLWDDEAGPGAPAFGPIRRRLERLIELGRSDDVISLGRELIREGNKLVERTDDEGEMAADIASLMPTVFRALPHCGLPGPERLLFAVDAILDDEFGLSTDAASDALDQPWPADDWSEVADELARRLARLGRGGGGRDYRRDELSKWLGRALEQAGRGDEVGALYEAEVRATGNYERYVDFLLAAGRDAEAERWAAEGIRAKADALPGDAALLAGKLRALAERRGEWDVVAAHAARDFFAYPSQASMSDLMSAARKAGVETPTRAAARRFLETGILPVRPATPAAETRVRRGTKPPPAPPGVSTDADWPLPLPDALAPLMPRRPAAGPHFDVLLDLAIASRQPDEALRWFDRAREERSSTASAYADRVAEAVAATHPQRAFDLFRAALDRQLPRASPDAYDAAAGYLRVLRPLYEALGGGAEWPQLVASLRERYRNRPRFVERLDALIPPGTRRR